MRAVYSFSATGRSRRVAAFFAERLETDVVDIRRDIPISAVDTAVVLFPVYCQNIPEPVRAFLPRMHAENVVLIACYGRMHHGNVLMEAAKLVSGQVIAAGYVPIGHTYLDETADVDPNGLEPILERIKAPKPAELKREYKNPLADLFPKLRGQLGVRISRTESCNHCGLCGENCPVGAMEDGAPKRGCIRCLRCVARCPQRALEVRYTWPLGLYLKKQKKNKTILYL